MIPKLSQLNAAERNWLVNNIAATHSLIAESCGESTPVESTSLDIAFETWLSQHNFETEDPNPILNAFGVTFGQYLDVQWVVASDKHGTEMAVHGQPGDILVFPLNLVAKRYVARETGFFAPARSLDRGRNFGNRRLL